MYFIYMARKTLTNVVRLLNEAIPVKVSRNEFCRKTGINRNSVDRYMAGIGEPTTETLQKLAKYFGVTVAELRGKGLPFNEYLKRKFQIDLDAAQKELVNENKTSIFILTSIIESLGFYQYVENDKTIDHISLNELKTLEGKLRQILEQASQEDKQIAAQKYFESRLATMGLTPNLGDNNEDDHK